MSGAFRLKTSDFIAYARFFQILRGNAVFSIARNLRCEVAMERITLTPIAGHSSEPTSLIFRGSRLSGMAWFSPRELLGNYPSAGRFVRDGLEGWMEFGLLGSLLSFGANERLQTITRI